MSELSKDREGANGTHRFGRILPWLIVIVLCPLTIVVTSMLGRRSYVVSSVLIVLYALIPFLVRFERRSFRTRELAIFAVMVAISIASRAAFAMIPGFKPIGALVMITGIAFGASPGFLCGALSMLVSNFMFGQGPWTVFQMLSFGLCGFVFGILSEHGVIKRAPWNMPQRILASALGLAFFVFVAGPILDTSSVFWMLSTLTPEAVLSVYIAGFPFNMFQGIAIFITLFVIGNPLLKLLDRVKTKYGLWE